MHLLKYTVLLLILPISFIGCSGQEVKEGVKVIMPEEVSANIKPTTLKEFILGPGDIVEVFVWRETELTNKYQISPSGNFSYPFLGKVKAGGKSIEELKAIIETGLSKFFKNPVVNVSLSAINSRKVYVLGEVKVPGLFTMEGPMNVMEAISLSGGFTDDANSKSVIIMRGDRNSPKLIRLDIKSFIKNGDFSQNISLNERDIVYVPPTYIADVAKFARYFRDIIDPVLTLEQSIILSPQVEDVFYGSDDGDLSRDITIIGK